MKLIATSDRIVCLLFASKKKYKKKLFFNNCLLICLHTFLIHCLHAYMTICCLDICRVNHAHQIIMFLLIFFIVHCLEAFDKYKGKRECLMVELKIVVKRWRWHEIGGESGVLAVIDDAKFRVVNFYKFFFIRRN